MKTFIPTCWAFIPEVIVEGLESLDVLAGSIGHLSLEIGSGLAAHIVAHADECLVLLVLQRSDSDWSVSHLMVSSTEGWEGWEKRECHEP